MKLRKFKIENHARLADAEIEVRDHLVLIGPNDVGKSSVLRCLDLLLGASTAQLYARISPSDFRDVQAPFIISATLSDFSGSEKAQYPDGIVVDSAGGLSLEVRLEARLEAGETLDIRRSMPHAGNQRQMTREELAEIGWRMIGATSTTRDLRENRASALDDILRSIDLGAERGELRLIADQLQTKLKTSPTLGRLRGKLATQLSRALPELVQQDDLTFVPGAAATDDVLSDVRLQVSRHGITRNLTEQSDGTRAMFAVALYDLVSESANVVAVDEPELHLHPSSQRSIGTLLRGGDNQKIVATHSADVVGAFQPDCIVAVKPGGVLVQPQPAFLTAEETLLVHWWNRDKLEPLTANHIVAVEGVSDRLILQRAAELAGRDLDRLGVSLVEVGGAGNMQPVLKLFGPTGFNVPLSILIDSDAVDKTAEVLGVSPADISSKSVWISVNDLEDEYVAALGASACWSALEKSKLFSANELGNCSTSGPNGERIDEDVAEFCRRKKYKVRAAMAIAPELTMSSAQQIKSVNGLLSSFASSA